MGVKVREKKKGSGVWWIFIDHQGTRKAKKIGNNKRLAHEVAEKIRARLTLGDFGIVSQENQKIPNLKEYVYGWRDKGADHLGWLDKVAQMSLKNSTRRGYRQIIDLHLIPAFGSKRLDRITPRSISDFIYGCFNNGLKSGTVKNIKNCLSAILRHASSQDGFILTNPARGITVPRPEDERPSREPDPFTWEERDQLESVFRRYLPRYYPLVICGLRSGLRIGELIGLKWEDIDFFNQLIHVERNITRGKVTTPKSRSSRRPVRMTSQLVSVLKDQRKRVKAEKLKNGWNEVPEWVFYNEDGGFLNYGNFVHRVWNRGIEKSMLRRRTPHDMRHTYATLRLSKGDSLAEVSKEMGHGTPDITYRTYYKWLPKESRSNIDELDGGSQSAGGRILSAAKKEKGLSEFAES